MDYERKAKEALPVLAICYDFDKTLALTTYVLNDRKAAHLEWLFIIQLPIPYLLY